MEVKKTFFVTVVLISFSGGLASKMDENTLETIEPKGPSYDNECAEVPARLSQELSSIIMSRHGVRIQRIFR